MTSRPVMEEVVVTQSDIEAALDVVRGRAGGQAASNAMHSADIPKVYWDDIGGLAEARCSHSYCLLYPLLL